MLPAPNEEFSASIYLMRSDLRLMMEVSTQMIVGGLSQSVDWATDATYDCFEIRRMDAFCSTLSTCLLPTGRYFYMNHGTGEVCLANTLSDALEHAGLLLLEADTR